MQVNERKHITKNPDATELRLHTSAPVSDLDPYPHTGCLCNGTWTCESQYL
jgi:hypothetical protein